MLTVHEYTLLKILWKQINHWNGDEMLVEVMPNKPLLIGWYLEDSSRFITDTDDQQ